MCSTGQVVGAGLGAILGGPMGASAGYLVGTQRDIRTSEQQAATRRRKEKQTLLGEIERSRQAEANLQQQANERIAGAAALLRARLRGTGASTQRGTLLTGPGGAPSLLGRTSLLGGA